jgi:hypothetical protein
MKIKAKYIGKPHQYFNDLEGKQILWLEFEENKVRASLFTYQIEPLIYKEYYSMKEFFEDWTDIKTKGKMEYKDF